MPSDSWDTHSAQAVRTQPFPVSWGLGGGAELWFVSPSVVGWMLA